MTREKQDSNRAISEYHFSSLKQKDVRMSKLKMNTLKLAKGGKLPNGENSTHNGSDSMFNFRADPDLSEMRKVVVGQIPCCCESCLNQLKLPWDDKKEAEDQPRYARNENCRLWNIF